MIRLKPASCFRELHMFNPLRGSQVKEKLRNFEKSSVIISKTPKELGRIKAKKELEFKTIRKKAYSRQQAQHVLRAKYDIPEDEFKDGKIGPASQSDSKFLTLVKDRRMLYTILGVNGEQLRDSKLVAEDVKKFLKRGQVEKAVFLARLAKKKGSAAMNEIMEYYFLELGFPQSGVQMYNWRKKWGIPPNEYTHTILFNGLAQQKQHISKANGDIVLNIVKRMIEKDELTQIEYNAALGALSNCTDVTHAFELYEKKITNVRRDTITFLWMIRACCRVKTTKIFKEVISGVMDNIPTRCLDSQLIFEYCKAISSRAEDKELKRATLKALCKYYELGVDESQLPDGPKFLNILPLSHWAIDQKFKINPSTVGLFLDSCLECEEYKIGINLFDKLKESNSALLDLGMYYNYMDLLIRNFPTSCGERCLKVFQDIEANGHLISTKHTIILVYRAFLRQASRKYVNTDVARVENMLNTCQIFVKDQEGIHSGEFKERIQPFQSWKYFIRIWKEANADNKVKTERLKHILDDFSKSFCCGEFGIESKSAKLLEDEKFIELEVVRLLKTFANRLELPNVETLDVTSLGPHRDTFLLRRLILRIKDKLLEHIEMIENKQRNGKVINDLEWSIKQLAQKLLSTKLASTIDTIKHHKPL